MRIRPLTEADLPVLRTWMNEAPEAPRWSDADFAALMAEPTGEARVRKAWVAEQDNRRVGFVAASALLIPNVPAECEIEFLFVESSFRRRGTGRDLVSALLAWSGSVDARDIWLEVRESNLSARRFYERLGFVITGQRPGYYADPIEDAVLMRLQPDCKRHGAPV
jgi:[ribosomal protein S18]-alanine N-acetyltransferase